LGTVIDVMGYQRKVWLTNKGEKREAEADVVSVLRLLNHNVLTQAASGVDVNEGQKRDGWRKRGGWGRVATIY
jgi:hypothetical protein